MALTSRHGEAVTVKVREPSEAGWLTVGQLVAHLEAQGVPGVTRRAVERWLGREHEPLPSILLGGRRLVHRADLAAWLERGRRGAGQVPA